MATEDFTQEEIEEFLGGGIPDERTKPAVPKKDTKSKIQTVSIHGKEYVPVAERIKLAGDRLVGVKTKILLDDESAVTVRAIVYISGDQINKYYGHATSDKTKNTIEGQSPIEVAETSAVGRALGFAGFGVVDGIASAEEVINATQKVKPKKGEKCAVCGAIDPFHKPTCPNAKKKEG